MKLSNQCCTLEQGKKLKELGVQDESYFVHLVYNGISEHIAPRWAYDKDSRVQGPAFTVAELGQMLPQQIAGDTFTIIKDLAFTHEDSDPETAYTVGYKGDIYFNIGCGTSNIAEAAAGCLIILLQNREITAEEANNRLINS